MPAKKETRKRKAQEPLYQPILERPQRQVVLTGKALANIPDTTLTHAKDLLTISTSQHDITISPKKEKQEESEEMKEMKPSTSLFSSSSDDDDEDYSQEEGDDDEEEDYNEGEPPLQESDHETPKSNTRRSKGRPKYRDSSVY